jgi:hypothetical protein
MNINALAADLEETVCPYPGTRKALEAWVSDQLDRASDAAVPKELIDQLLQSSYLLHVQTLLDADEWDAGQ